MQQFPIFLSVAIVIRNQDGQVAEILVGMTERLTDLVSDYELIVIDNASNDDSLAALKALSGENGLPNLQIYALTKEVDWDTAYSVAIENALGDFVAIVDPLVDGISFLPEMLTKSMEGADIVFARNEQKQQLGLAYRFSAFIFNGLYKIFNGVDLSNESPQYRLLSKKLVNYILQHPQPSLAYRFLPATSGFSRASISYEFKPTLVRKKTLMDSVDRGIRLMVSTTRAPMRVVTALSVFGALTNIVYSLYVMVIWLFKDDVAPGWVSLSLQQSGMFLLISLVLLVLGEYILNMTSQANEGPRFHIAQEFTSARLTRKEKLNIEEEKRSNPLLESGS